MLIKKNRYKKSKENICFCVPVKELNRKTGIEINRLFEIAVGGEPVIGELVLIARALGISDVELLKELGFLSLKDKVIDKETINYYF